MNGINTETHRKSARAKIGSEIAYLNFDSGNGAIVLDVSPEGLGFQAADRLEPSAPLSFRLCTSELPNIDLAGEIAWLDETRKRGGLRLKVPAVSRPAYQQWLRKHFESLIEAEQKVDAAPSAPRIPDPTRSSPPTAAQNREPAASVPTSAAPPPARPAGRGPIFVSEWELPPEEPHTSRTVLVVCVILVLGLAIAGSYYFGGRRQVGAVLIRLGESLGGSSQEPLRTLNATNANAISGAQPSLPSQSADAASAPAVPPTTSPVTPNPAASAAPVPSNPMNGLASAGTSNASPTADSETQARSNIPPLPAAAAPITNANSAGAASQHEPSVVQPKASNANASPSAPAPVGTPAPPPDYGLSDVAQARKLLQDSNPQDSAVAADLLWSAVSKGNTKAEMMLADLYLEGRGTVAKNCRQAEALLTAAQTANVPGAEQKIEELQTYGCR